VAIGSGWGSIDDDFHIHLATRNILWENYTSFTGHPVSGDLMWTDKKVLLEYFTSQYTSSTNP
jgi:hypothetical protein